MSLMKDWTCVMLEEGEHLVKLSKRLNVVSLQRLITYGLMVMSYTNKREDFFWLKLTRMSSQTNWCVNSLLLFCCLFFWFYTKRLEPFLYINVETALRAQALKGYLKARGIFYGKLVIEKCCVTWMLTQDSQEALKSRLSNIAPKAGLPTGLLPSASRPRALSLVYFIYVCVISLTANLLQICNFDEQYELLHHHRPRGTTCTIVFRDLIYFI